MDSSRNFRSIRVIIFVTSVRSTLLTLEEDPKISLTELNDNIKSMYLKKSQRSTFWNGGSNKHSLSQYINLWHLVNATELQQDHEDQITWTQTAHGEYTTVSAYKAQFNDCISTPTIAIIWKTWAPPKCKFFAWLIVQDRVWTSDLLARREWDHNPSCLMCRSTMETAHHLLASCRYTRQTWNLAVDWPRMPDLKLNAWRHSMSVLQWWKNINTTPDIPQKGVRTVTLLVMWEI
jgi:hypothetical protein